MSDRAKTVSLIVGLLTLAGAAFGLISTIDSMAEKHVNEHIGSIQTTLTQDRKDIDENRIVGEQILRRIGPIEADVKVTRNDIGYIKEDLAEIKTSIARLVERRSE